MYALNLDIKLIILEYFIYELTTKVKTKVLTGNTIIRITAAKFILLSLTITPAVMTRRGIYVIAQMEKYKDTSRNYGYTVLQENIHHFFCHRKYKLFSHDNS
jgi:hypothetical protein